jgi:hypothetical protein
VSELTALTETEMIVTASEFLIGGGYRLIAHSSQNVGEIDRLRIFEDPYGIVALVVYPTWDQLVSQWPDAQGALVAIMSQYVPKAEAKAWEGYLVLLTPGGLLEGTTEQMTTIRYDMTRVRKLVASGSELSTISAIERVLRPLLPLRPQAVSSEVVSAIDLLPELLEADEIPRGAVFAMIDAFRSSSSITEALHTWTEEGRK